VPAIVGPPIPQARIDQAAQTAAIIGEGVYKNFPFVEGAAPASRDLKQLLLQKTWLPTLSVTGAEGLPALGQASNALRPYTALKLSVRVGPRTGRGRGRGGAQGRARGRAPLWRARDLRGRKVRPASGRRLRAAEVHPPPPPCAGLARAGTPPRRRPGSRTRSTRRRWRAGGSPRPTSARAAPSPSWVSRGRGGWGGPLHG